MNVSLIVELTQALHREAQLLDDGRYEDWLDLLDPDIRYVAKIRADELGHMTRPPDAPVLSYFDDGLEQLQVRVAKIRTGLPQSEHPASRTVRLIGTVTVEAPVSDRPDIHSVRSAFILYRHRRQRQIEILSGHRDDEWRPAGAPEHGWRLLRREVHFAANVLPTKSLSLLY